MKAEPKLRGIYSEQTLECGCKLKKFTGGLNVIDPWDRDPNCDKHINFKENQCRVCDEKFESYSKLRKQRWTHAI